MRNRTMGLSKAKVLTIVFLWATVALVSMFALTPCSYAAGQNGQAITQVVGIESTQSAKSYSSTKITKSNPVVVIRVSYATGKFSNAYPPGGTYSAARVKRQSGYELYDVVLWSNRISCYYFGKDFADIWDEYVQTHGFPDVDKANSACLKLREKYCISWSSVKCGQYENTNNSAAKYKAFAKIFKAIKKRTPSKHVVLKYSGHGGGVNLFCAINEKYSLKTLAAGTKTFGAKFAIIDYGTNCASASAYTLDKYAPYTDYMIMCQQDWGGWSWDARTQNADGTIKQAYLYVDSDSRYHEAFKLGKNMRDAARRLVDLNRDEWTSLAKTYIKKHQIRCSNIAVDTKAFAKLRSAMKKSRKLAAYDGNDVYASIKGDANLRALYKKSVVAYRRTKDLGVTWSKYENGINIY
ncbi:MAG: hypothetical protein Q4A07_07295 [Coriobacteriales bacterium]|nr:hypothetical protein [Coriobacteriales bacterium]